MFTNREDFVSNLAETYKKLHKLPRASTPESVREVCDPFVDKVVPLQKTIDLQYDLTMDERYKLSDILYFAADAIEHQSAGDSKETPRITALYERVMAECKIIDKAIKKGKALSSRFTQADIEATLSTAKSRLEAIKLDSSEDQPKKTAKKKNNQRSRQPSIRTIRAFESQLPLQHSVGGVTTNDSSASEMKDATGIALHVELPAPASDSLASTPQVTGKRNRSQASAPDQDLPATRQRASSSTSSASTTASLRDHLIKSESEKAAIKAAEDVLDSYLSQPFVSNFVQIPSLLGRIKSVLPGCCFGVPESLSDLKNFLAKLKTNHQAFKAMWPMSSGNNEQKLIDHGSFSISAYPKEHRYAELIKTELYQKINITQESDLATRIKIGFFAFGQKYSTTITKIVNDVEQIISILEKIYNDLLIAQMTVQTGFNVATHIAAQSSGAPTQSTTAIYSRMRPQQGAAIVNTAAMPAPQALRGGNSPINFSDFVTPLTQRMFLPVSHRNSATRASANSAPTQQAVSTVPYSR